VIALLAILIAQPAAAQGTLAEHLERALALDADSRGIEAQREAERARGALARSPVPGSFALQGSARVDTRGPREAFEADIELGAPLWLPGQRGAVGNTVTRNVDAEQRRLGLRRLEVAGLLREGWWDAALRRAETRLARDRVATGRDIVRDVERRYAQGEVPLPDLLLAQNELVAAELNLAQAEAAETQSLAAYRTLTGGAAPSEAVERPAPRGEHPALLAAQAAVAAAEAQVRLVAVTPMDNPELSGFMRNQQGDMTEQGVSFGLRLRVPLPSEARNAPRRANAQAALTRATAQLAQFQRITDAAVSRAEAALRASEQARRLARQRLSLANQQLEIANRGYRAGEITLFDLVRVRQIQIDAASAAAQTEVSAGLARARLNQALGALPR